MSLDFLEIIPEMILWSGYAVIAALLALVIRNLHRTVDNWGDLFVQRMGDSPHLSRYSLLLLSIVFAARFVLAVLRSDEKDMADTIEQAFSLDFGFGMTEATGATGVAYLLSKVTDGNIFSLFGFNKKN